MNPKLIFCLVSLSLFLWHCQTESNQNQPKKVAEQLSPSFPEKADFAGESLPLHRRYVQEALDLELIKNTYWHSNTILLLKRKAKYFPLIEKTLQDAKLPEDLKYLAAAESNLDPTIVSPAKAKGLWQFMPATAREFGLRVDEEIDERSNVQKSTLAAVQYLRALKDSTNSWSLAAASYNAGLGNIRKAINEQLPNTKKPNYFDLKLFKETERYVYRIVALKHILSEPKKYGFDLDSTALYKNPSFDSIEIQENVDNWMLWCKNKQTTYKTLRAYNPWIVGKQLTVPTNQRYLVLLPKQE